MEVEALHNELKLLLEAEDSKAIEQYLADWLPVDIAEVVEEVEQEQRLLLFKVLDRARAVKTFEQLETGLQQKLLEDLNHRQVALILNDMSADDRTALLEEVSPDLLSTFLKLLSKKERSVALHLLGYPEDSIGRLMTPDYIAVKEDWSVGDVLNYIRKYGEDRETINIIYVIDDQGRLIDDIKISSFLVTPFESKVRDIMDDKFVSLSVMDDEEVAIGEFRKHNRIALPVTNNNGFLLGIVTMDDVLQLAQEEDTEDIQKIGGVEALDDPYMEVPVIQMIQKRAPWLIILFIGELLTASAMAYFEDEIAKAVVLALFVPLIVSSGGNTGSQAATLIIRAMALEEVTLKDWWRIMRREIVSGLVLGLILGILGYLRVAIWSMATDLYGPHWNLIGLTVGFSLVGVVLWGTLMGSMLPLVLKRLGADPATSSAPFVATLVDVTGLIIYFTIAVSLLTGTLL